MHPTNTSSCSVQFNDIKSRPNIRYDKRDLGDGSAINIKSCTSKKCIEFCPRFLPSNRIYSTVTGRYIDCVNEMFPHVVDCNSVNVIYVITCANCYLQYVGETVGLLNVRFCIHRAVMRGKSYTDSCKRLRQHFTSGCCKGAEYFVQVAERLVGDGRLADGVIDPEFTKLRRTREDSWMLKLRTVYPYGLNDDLNFASSSKFPQYSNFGIIGKIFPPLPRQHARTWRTHNHNNHTPSNNFMSNIQQWVSLELNNAAFNIRSVLSGMNKKSLKKTASQIGDFLSEAEEDFIYFTWYKMALDIIETKLYHPPEPPKSKSIPKYKLNIGFVNKGLEFINLPKILRSETVKGNSPHLMEETDVPMVVYSLSQPIRSKVFNYKQFVKNLDLDLFCRNNKSIPCHCKKYDPMFVDTNAKHVLTGNLNIIKNNKLRKLLSKGPKYREPAKIDWGLAKMVIEEALDSFIEHMASTKGVTPEYFDNWKHTILGCVDSKIVYFSPKIKEERVQVLENFDVKNELKTLRDHFILVPIDKASNNISFICKQHYANLIKNELGYSIRSSRRLPESPAYEVITDMTVTDIIDKHTADMPLYGLSVDEEFQSLPVLYLSAKFHKNPISSRTIIASKTSSLKPLLKDLTLIFKLFQSQVQSFNDKHRVWTGVSGFWVIQNNTPLIDRIGKINKRNKAKSIMTFDFSTLYTKIPHDLLIQALNEIIDFCFKGGISNAVYVTEDKVSWRKSGKARAYTKGMIKMALKYAIDNSYFHVGEKVFRQKIGIPIGSDPAPFFANLFLYVYESKFIANLLKTDPDRARRLRHIFRFIDDLIAINDDGEFEKSFLEIYPPEMELKRENSKDDAASYLDLGLEINEKRISSNLYDKRNAFNFSIVRLPYRCSNIPSKMFYATISAEILRIARATSKYTFFLNCVQTLLVRMKKQGANVSGIQSAIRKMIGRHAGTFSKFEQPIEKIIRDCQ